MEYLESINYKKKLKKDCQFASDVNLSGKGLQKLIWERKNCQINGGYTYNG